MRLRFLLGLVGTLAGLGFACGDDPSPETFGTTSDAGAVVPSDGGEPDPKPLGDAGPGPLAYVPRDLNHVLSTGQSLSVGAVGSPPLSTTQPYDNRMFAVGVITGATGLTALAPLVEGRVDGGTSPNVETMSAGFANLVTKLAREQVLLGRADVVSHDLLVSVHGKGGTAYVGLKKGTEPYTNGIAQAKAGFDLAKALGKSYVVRAVTNVHGESDHVAKNAAYDKDLAAWQADYENDVKAITGQTEPIPMFHVQMSSWTRYTSATSAIPQAQLVASTASAGKIVLVGPKYQVAYAPDGVHLTNTGYRHLGEYFGKVYKRVILEGKPWEPVRPLSVSRSGAVITLKFSVPAPPLVLDTDLVKDPGAKGFEFAQVGANPAITGVAVTAPDTVTITLASVPTGTNQRIRYAYTGTIGASAGTTTGPRGNLRDSDTTPSRDGNSLFNWCVHFDEAVP